MNPIWVRTASRRYAVHVGRGILGSLPGLLARHPACRAAGGSAVMVSDASLFAGPAGRAASALERAGWRVSRGVLPAGEAAKTLSSLDKLYGFLLKSGAERRTPLVAVGGGSIGDAAGFAAATYQRGIPLVHVPTTFLAQADSAIGGKTAVDHPLAKNAVGAFYQPIFVLADVETLRTLPRRQLMSGLAEAVKCALVFDPAFARRLAARWPRVRAGDLAELEHAVRTSVAWKARAVSADEFDLAGKRELLNFGHTLGHALEWATGYRGALHGEAVVWGMRAALELSSGRGWLRRDRPLADALLDGLAAPAWPRGLASSDLWAAMRRDKKVRAGRNVFVLLKRIGEPARVDDVTKPELAAALRRLGVTK
ncbi:MAG: 3-dehydroquinate synthase [Elusimicrobia bacterium]|nr:3-dehydroquinate synthase [Elusimicrobiota bacterium]